MAKNNKWKWTIGVIVTIFVFVATVAWDASTKSSEIETNKKDIEEIKPIVNTSKERIDKLEIRWEYIDEDVAGINDDIFKLNMKFDAHRKEIMTEQKAMTDIILTELRKK